MDGLELAKQLVRSVVRAFYETEHIVLIDGLVNHSALSLADLALVMDMGKQHKAAQKICGKLREGGLVSVYGRQELREGAQKAVTREYYYIDYRRAVDATKYRIHMLDEKVKADSKPTTEKKEFNCPQCLSQWTTLELMGNAVPYGNGFLCNLCDHMVDPIDDRAAESQDDTPAKFNKQFGLLLNLLQKIDDALVPEITGDQALAAAAPLPRDERLNPAVKSEPVAPPTVRPTAVKGMATGPELVEVKLTTNSESTAAEIAAEAARKERLAQQNQLPEWHTRSTVDNSEFGKGAANGALESTAVAPTKQEEEAEEKKVVDPVMEEYWAQIEADRQRELKEREEEDEDEEEDDDEEEFEDVPIAEAEAAPEAKRVKIEEPPTSTSTPAAAADTPTAGAAPATAEESEEDEFEDAI